MGGLPVKRYQLIAHVLSGLSAVIAGLFLTSRLGTAAPQASTGLELRVIAAIILDGTSLSGGKGSLFGTLLGVLILGTLDNAMTLLSISSYYRRIALGVILLLAVGAGSTACWQFRPLLTVTLLKPDPVYYVADGLHTGPAGHRLIIEQVLSSLNHSEIP